VKEEIVDIDQWSADVWHWSIYQTLKDAWPDMSDDDLIKMAHDPAIGELCERMLGLKR